MACSFLSAAAMKPEASGAACWTPPSLPGCHAPDGEGSSSLPYLRPAPTVCLPKPAGLGLPVPQMGLGFPITPGSFSVPMNLSMPTAPTGLGVPTSRPSVMPSPTQANLTEPALDLSTASTLASCLLSPKAGEQSE